MNPERLALVTAALLYLSAFGTIGAVTLARHLDDIRHRRTRRR
jgi:hypothetical protein